VLQICNIKDESAAVPISEISPDQARMTRCTSMIDLTVVQQLQKWHDFRPWPSWSILGLTTRRDRLIYNFCSSGQWVAFGLPFP